MAVRKKVISDRNRKAVMKKLNTIKRLQSKVKGMKMIEERLKSKEEKIENLKKHVECPVCLDVPRKGPIFACPNGHIICQKCKGGLCPICRVEVGQNKSIVAVALIENIHHDCKFDGCDEEYPLDIIENHEKYCDHRIVICPHPQCEQKVQLSKILDHLGESQKCCKDKVPRVIFGSSGVQAFSVADFPRMIANPGLSWAWPGPMFSCSGNKFNLCAIKSGEYYHFTMVMFESPVICSAVNLEMEVYDSRSPPQTRLSVKIRCNPCSIDEVKSDMKYLGLTVHHKVMEKMALREESFDFTVLISFL